MSTQNIIYVDSRFRTNVSDSDSNFSFQLAQSLELIGARFRIDACHFIDSFYTVENFSCNVYFSSSSAPGYTSYQIPIGMYTGADFASVLQSVTGRTCTYNTQLNSLVMNDPTIMTDTQLIALGISNPNSINGILRHGDKIVDAANFVVIPSTSVQSGSYITFPFLDLQCYDSVYLRSYTLSCPNSRASCRQPNDILLKIPLTGGCGTIGR